VVAAEARLRANLAPVVRSDSVAGIPDPEFYPEGMDYDPDTKSWFVASVRRRTVARIGPDGRVVDFPRLGPFRLDAVLGVRVDSRRRILWATTRALPQMEGYQATDVKRARVVAFALDDGSLIAAADAPADQAPHLFGDLVIGSTGVVYLTDSESPILFRARLADGRIVVEEVLRHRLFRSLQGLAFGADETRLYLADYSHGLLLVDLAARSVRELSSPESVTTLGLDGIARYGRAIIGIQNGIAPPRVVRFALTADGAAITAALVIDRHLPIADEPTIGAVVDDRFVYVANSQWEKYADDGSRKTGAVLRPPVLLGIRLDRP
jgi:hypothetical protein